MAKRSRMGKRSSRKLFTKTASMTNSRNVHTHVMRGGIRL